MASNYWLKLYHEILDDPKVMTLRPALRWRFIECLLVAGEMDEGGILPDTNHYSWRVRDNAEFVETDLVELANAGLLSKHDGRWSVTKFAERQAPMTSTERTRRQREAMRKKKQSDALSKETWRMRLWKSLPETPGIYRISISQFVYIGGSVNVQRRVKQHLTEMATVSGSVLFDAFSEYGKGAVTVTLLEEVPEEQLVTRENFWMAQEDASFCLNHKPSQRHRDWPETRLGQQRDDSGTNCPTDKIREDKDTDTDTRAGAVFSAIENELGHTLTPMLTEKVNARIDEHGAQEVLDAIAVAVENGVYKWRYVVAVLDRWKREGRDSKPRTENEGAVLAFERLQEAIERNDYKGLPPDIIAAVRRTGRGSNDLRRMPADKMPFYRREFLEAYHAAG